jgi:hypothetical protein
MRFDGLEGCVDRAVAVRCAFDFFARHSKDDAGLGPLAGFTVLGQRDKTVMLVVMRDGLIAHQRQNIFIKYLGLFVRQFFELGERGIDVGLGLHRYAQV